MRERLLLLLLLLLSRLCRRHKWGWWHRTPLVIKSWGLQPRQKVEHLQRVWPFMTSVLAPSVLFCYCFFWLKLLLCLIVFVGDMDLDSNDDVCCWCCCSWCCCWWWSNLVDTLIILQEKQKKLSFQSFVNRTQYAWGIVKILNLVGSLYRAILVIGPNLCLV